MKTTKCFYIFILTFLLASLFSTACSAHTIFDHFRCKAYDGEGEFVGVPAKSGSMIGFLILTIPVMVISVAPIEMCDLCGCEETSKNICECIGFSTMWPTSALFGAPFYLLKKTFWDGPILFWHTITHESTSNHPVSPGTEQQGEPVW